MQVSPEFVEGAARLAHAALCAYAEGFGQVPPKPYGQLSADDRASVADGVCYVVENPAAGPDALHQNWFNYKIAEGWQYGEQRDVAAKKHPNMVPFHELHVYEQAKDHVFRAIVLELARVAGYALVRKVNSAVASDEEPRDV